MMTLITGTPGSGKTLFAVSKILELQKQFPDRQIYSDIEGLKIEGVELAPEDWRTTPENSIIFYDEAQQHERFRSGTSANKDDIVQALQVHRHTGHDIYFITQSPRFLNAFVLDLIGEHYHLHRPYGAKLASVYFWRVVQKQPTSEASKERSENNFKFVYPKEIFKLYKSATAHHVKLKIPTKILGTFGIAAAVLGMVGFLVYKPQTQAFFTGKQPTEQKGFQKEIEEQQAKATAKNEPQKLQNLDQECRKGVNVEKPECVEWFNNLSKSNQSVQASNPLNVQSVSYNPSKPFDDTGISTALTYEVTAKPVFAGCLKKNGRYIAYTQQGTILNEVSQADCKRVVEHGERPFNYFKQPEPVQVHDQTQQQLEPVAEKPSTHVIPDSSVQLKI